MSSYVLFAILGLGAGATYGILGLGLVLKYRAAGVVDFGHGAVAMFIAYVFLGLRQDGQLELPWVILPHHIQVGSTNGITTWLSLAIALVYAAALGLVLYVVVFRPIRSAPTLARICASVGVMLALQAIAVLNFGSTAKSVLPILPSSSLSLAGITFPTSSLWFTGIMVAAAVLLGIVYKTTRFGLSTTAGAENPSGASLFGISANRIAALNWVIASVLAGLAGILIAPVANLDPTSYTLFVIPALGCALVARFESFSITAITGLLIGIGQSEITKLLSMYSWLPQQGLPDTLPFVVIIVAMALRSRSVLARSETTSSHNPSVGRPTSTWATAAVCLVVGTLALVVLQGSLRNGLITSFTFACVALSVVVLTGFVGQVSLAQMSFAGIGGFMLGHISTGLGLGFPWSLILAGLCAVPVGLLIGLPALRLRGVNLAVVTLGAAAAMDALVFNISSFSGGVGGLVMPTPRLFGLDLGIAQGHDYPRAIFGVFVLVIVIVLAILVARLRQSATGRMLLAIRSNERAASSLGINVAEAKLMAFALAAFIAGIGGALTGYQQGTLTPDSFSVLTSLGLLAVVFVAGVGRISGAVFAGVMMSAAGLFVTFLNNEFSIGQYQTIVAGLALTITAIANPDGVMSTEGGKGPAAAFLRLRALVGGRIRRPAAPAALAPPNAAAPSRRAKIEA